MAAITQLSTGATPQRRFGTFSDRSANAYIWTEIPNTGGDIWTDVAASAAPTYTPMTNASTTWTKI
jgi:hypothetical protein